MSIWSKRDNTWRKNGRKRRAERERRGGGGRAE